MPCSVPSAVSRSTTGRWRRSSLQGMDRHRRLRVRQMTVTGLPPMTVLGRTQCQEHHAPAWHVGLTTTPMPSYVPFAVPRSPAIPWMSWTSVGAMGTVPAPVSLVRVRRRWDRDRFRQTRRSRCILCPVRMRLQRCPLSGLPRLKVTRHPWTCWMHRVGRPRLTGMPWQVPGAGSLLARERHQRGRDRGCRPLGRPCSACIAAPRTGRPPGSARVVVRGWAPPPPPA